MKQNVFKIKESYLDDHEKYLLYIIESIIDNIVIYKSYLQKLSTFN